VSHNDKQFATVFVAVLGALAVLAIILYFLAGMLGSGITPGKSEEVILKNIAPVGQVKIAGESPAGEAAPVAEAAAATEAAAPMTAEQIYQTNCLACHATGVAGAPKTGDAAAWAPRIANGMDTMVSNAVKGLNAMPAMGTCMSCSEDDIRGVVEYIVAQSQ
jgi:cytochrome c5